MCCSTAQEASPAGAKTKQPGKEGVIISTSCDLDQEGRTTVNIPGQKRPTGKPLVVGKGGSETEIRAERFTSLYCRSS
jgi:hypothetical protein